MKFENPFWSNKTKIELLEKWILIHSTIYYEHDKSVISDGSFDSNARQLVDLINADQDAFRRSKWYSVFEDYDGSTGFHLYRRLPKKHQKAINKIAMNVIRIKEEMEFRCLER